MFLNKFFKSCFQEMNISDTEENTLEHIKSLPSGKLKYIENVFILLIYSLISDWTLVQITKESSITSGRNNISKLSSKLKTPTIYISRVECGPSPDIYVYVCNVFSIDLL